MRRIILTASMLAVLMLAICASFPGSHETLAQDDLAVLCCGKKPTFSDPAYSTVFTGQVAVTTSFVPADNGFVVGIVDLKNQATAPLNVNYAPPMYHGPAAAQWTKARLGNVFGLTLDDLGNIYVTATTAYSFDYFPANAIGGEVYKIDGVTGGVTKFTVLSNTGGAGLGNISFDCIHHRFYVSDIDDGKVYSLDMGGNTKSTWDHGLNLLTATPSAPQIPDNPSQQFTARGRRVWGLQTNNGRLYYAVWWVDRNNPLTAHSNEIWSVGLDANGDFIGSARLEISLPPLVAGGTDLRPVSDISFGPNGTMLLSERSMINETVIDAHYSRVLEYTFNGTAWTLLNPTKFIFNPNRAKSAAGGADYDFAPAGLVWASGDALHYPTPISNPPENDFIYGIMGVPMTGGSTHTGILIDLDVDVTSSDKKEMGDVDIPCPAVVGASCMANFAAIPACPGQVSTFTDLSTGATSWSWNFGDGGTSTDQNPAHIYAAAGSYPVTLVVNGGVCILTRTVTVTSAPAPPVITGPSTTCQSSGTYSIPAQPGIRWTVTNGTPTTGTGNSINVTWNATGNGLVAVTVTSPETCCKTTTQMIVNACSIASVCCENMSVNAVLPNLGFGFLAGSVYKFAPQLTAAPNNITNVSATVISTSLTFTPTSCGTSGPVSSYIANAPSPAAFASSLPVQYSRAVTWKASAGGGVNLSGGLSFPFDIQIAVPFNGPRCTNSISFCVKYTFTDVNCRTCEMIRCYGPYPERGRSQPLSLQQNAGSPFS